MFKIDIGISARINKAEKGYFAYYQSATGDTIMEMNIGTIYRT